MKLKLQKLLITVGLWLVRQAGGKVCLQPKAEILALADQRVEVAERVFRGTSGEFKRHQVYAQLRKAFPGERGHELGVSIELVCRERGL